jgi:hypothetical protein
MIYGKLGGLMIFALSLMGCATHQGTDYINSRNHMLYIDGYGNLVDPVTGGIVGDGGLATTKELEKAYLDKIFENFYRLKQRDKKLKMTIFIHGGLNDFATAVNRPKLMTEAMLADNQYPIFIAWNSDFWPNYADHLFRIRKGLNRPVLGGISSPFIFVEDLGRSLVRIPASVYKEIADPIMVSKSVNSKDEKDYQRRVKRLKASGFSVRNPKPFVGVGPDYYTVLNPFKLIMAPFVDGFGTGAWDGMLRRTDLVLTKSVAFEGDVVTEPQKELKEPSSFADTAVTTFISKLEREAREEKAQSDDGSHVGSITLIGHSMGTIIAVNIIARHPDLEVDNLVFMGAAARVKEIENVVTPWLIKNPSANFWNLSLDPYREVGENFFYDFMPRGSLLNWIDFTFGQVNSFKDRTAGSWWNITRLAEDVFPAAPGYGAVKDGIRSRVHLTRFPIDNNGVWPQKHGEFADFKFWRQDYWGARESVKLSGL